MARPDVAWLAALALVAAVYLLRMDAVCGLYVDDGWYVLLAKALATGRGYTLINAPTPGVPPFYPPGFPWLLSLVFRIAPDFPVNVWVLKSLSVAAMVGVAVLTRGWLSAIGVPATAAAGLALATALHPAFAFLATSTVMSECVFACVQLATVVLVERAARERGGAASAIGAGVLAGYAFLVRSLGIGLVAAVVSYLFKERRWRSAVAFALATAVVVTPWLLHVRGSAPTLAQQAELNDPIMVPYSTQFWMNVAGHPARGMTAPADLPARAWGQLTVIAGRTMGGLVLYPWFRTIEPGSSIAVTPIAVALSCAATALALLGYASAVRRRIGVAELLTPAALGVVALWPFSPFRLVLPLLPFLLYYAALGVCVVARLATRRDDWRPAAATAALLALVNLTANAAYVWQRWGPPAERPPWLRIFAEHVDVLTWVREHVPEDQPVAAINPALVHLYTGRKTVGYYLPNIAPDEWALLGVHYLADTSYLTPNASLPEGRFPTVHRSPTMNLRVLDVGARPASGG
jgi:hypothetical protein